MRQPEPQSAVTSFLSALADDLSAPPDEMTSWRHVTAAAAIVDWERSAASSRAVRLAAAALIAVIGLGTGGVAMAGGLPAPIQDVAADVARAMPLPISIPYPTPVGVRSPAPADAERRPMDGEIHLGVARLAETDGTRYPLSPSPSELVDSHRGAAEGSHDTNGQDRRIVEPGDDDVLRARAGAESDEQHGHRARELDDEARNDPRSDDQGWSNERRSEDDRFDDERRSDGDMSDDERSDDDRSDGDRSDGDRSDGDRSDDDRSDDDRSDRD